MRVGPVLLFSFFASACGSSSASPDGSLDGSGDALVRPADPPGDDTVDFAIGFLRPGVAVGDEAPGFDLDGLTTTDGNPASPGCGKVDFRAPARFGGHAGVDNQLTSILDAVREVNPDIDIDGDLWRGIMSGRAIFGIRLSRVGDLVDDGRVDVSIVQLLVPEGGAPMTTEGIVGGGRVMMLAPGQTFVIDGSSLAEGLPRYTIENAFLLDGLLVTDETNFSLRVPASDERTLALDFRARLSGRVSTEGIENGVLGGWSTIEEVLQTIMTLEDTTIDPALARAILEGQADIRSDAELTRCDAISLGLEMHAVPAIFVDP